MQATEDKLVTVYIDTEHRKRLGVLVETIKPTPKIGAVVEHLIDAELERQGIDPSTLRPVEKP